MATNINPAQQQAVNHAHGPMEVIAGPGSGKTFTIVKRIINLIEQHRIPPEKILVITFTKASALEMQSRFLKEIRRSYSAVNFGTFHSIYYQIMSRSGYLSDYSLVTEAEKRKILRSILNHFFSAQTFSSADYGEILSEISLRKNLLPPISEREKMNEIFAEYCDMLKMSRKIDFDDMILSCHQMLSERESVLRTWQEYFTYLLVDEFQDINRLQYLVLKQIAAPRNNLFIVGDDDQSIYGFRGSNPQVMQDFFIDFPDCAKVQLPINYRSTRQIITAAEKVIVSNLNRLPKVYEALRDGTEPLILSFPKREAEEDWIIEKIKEISPTEHNETAIILRTNFEVGIMAAKCVEQGIKVRTTEKVRDILTHFIAVDILDYIHFSQGIKERSRFLNIINKPMRYLSRQCVADIGGEVSESEILAYYHGNPDAQGEVRRFFAACRRIGQMSPYLAINYIRMGVGYERYLKERAKPREFPEWMEICDELQEMARGYSTHEEWLDLLAGMKKLAHETEEEKGKQTDKDGLHIITMHSSKGLEFRTVFLPHLNEGTLPGHKSLTDEQIEEERRLFYVGMTRAKEELYLTCTESTKFVPSRFLKPLVEQK
ncbi:MAG: ATP-dependent helicase [Lachnospiraceae bacterium]|nr:ATP-dependent helicase [Lachnospiraceae bacterium]